jgi:hypothetical protein
MSAPRFARIVAGGLLKSELLLSRVVVAARIKPSRITLPACARCAARFVAKLPDFLNVSGVIHILTCHKPYTLTYVKA